MINNDILENNLNDRVSYTEFFKAFGNSGNDKVYFRTFDDKGASDKASKSDAYYDRTDNVINYLHEVNNNDRGIFFVVNGDGQTDKEVKHARAQFIDFDDFSFDEQIKRLNAFPLEPSIIVKTRKSLHCYWLLTDGKIKRFRSIQERLNSHFGSDPVIKNESRVMRLYGFEHRKAEPIMVKLIKFDPDIKYTQDQLCECLPEIASDVKPQKAAVQEVEQGQLIEKGHRHEYVVSKCGTYVYRLKKSADAESILALVEADFLRHCVHDDVDMVDFRQKYLETIKKFQNGGKVLDCNGKGLPLNKRHNYDRILEADPFFAGMFSYNMMDGCVYVSGAEWNSLLHRYNDIDEQAVQGYFSDSYSLDDTKKLAPAILGKAFTSRFHPIQDRLNAIRSKWDGKEHLKEFFPRYLGAARSAYTTEVTKLLFQGAIKRVLHPGCKWDWTFIIKGRQGSGKSTLVRFIALDDLFFTDDLKDMGSEKVFEKFRGKWIVELSEMLFTKSTAQIEAMKAFLSRMYDTYRTPYGKYPMDYPRQCIFIGTTNNTDFLPDDKTGNRRFIPIICENEPERHPLEDEVETRQFIEQCYAEAMMLGEREGYSTKLSAKAERQAAMLNSQSMPEDYRIGMIQEWLDETDRPYVCSRMIWDEVFCSESYPREPKRYDLADISSIMNNQIEGWIKYSGKDGNGKENVRRFDKYGRQRAWQRVTDAAACSQECSQGCSQGVHSNYDFVDSSEAVDEIPF